MQDSVSTPVKIHDYQIDLVEGTITLAKPAAKPSIGDKVRFKTTVDRAWVLFEADPPPVAFADGGPARPGKPISGTLTEAISNHGVLVAWPVSEKAVCTDAILIIDP